MSNICGLCVRREKFVEFDLKNNSFFFSRVKLQRSLVVAVDVVDVN